MNEHAGHDTIHSDADVVGFCSTYRLDIANQEAAQALRRAVSAEADAVGARDEACSEGPIGCR